VVTKDVAPLTVVGGVPAKVIRLIDSGQDAII
jgi:acetyltransferase-like isoleucine patch superfamily enzyme